MDLFTTSSMLAIVQRLRVPGRFLLDTYFPQVVEEESEEIHFDRLLDSLEAAPFVSPLSEAKRGVSSGVRVETFRPAYIKMLDPLDQNARIRRSAGEPVGGNLTPEARRQAALAQLLADHVDAWVRRLEIMAAEALRVGKITVTGDDYPTTVVDFARPAGHTKTLAGAAAWGQAGVSPVDNVEAWADELAAATGAPPDRIVMTADAWKLYAADPKFKDKISTQMRVGTSLADLGLQPGVLGQARWRGTDGSVDFYTYQDTFKDPVDGVVKNLLPAGTVILAATAAVEGVRAFGAILDDDDESERLSAPGVPTALAFFPKSFTTKNPGRRWVLSQSSPLLVPRRPQATLGATVL